MLAPASASGAAVGRVVGSRTKKILALFYSIFYCTYEQRELGGVGVFFPVMKSRLSRHSRLQLHQQGGVDELGLLQG